MDYEIARIVSEIDDKFLCSICTFVLENSMQLQCEHKFCNNCIKEWLKVQTSCPVDSCSLALADMKPTPRHFCNLLEKFEIKCNFEPKGYHITECAFNPNAEVICGNGCNMNQQKLITKLNDQVSRCEVTRSTNVMERQREEITELRGEVGLQREETMKFSDEVVQQREEITKLTDQINGQRDEITKLKNKLQESCGRAKQLPCTAMRGILDLDVVCMKNILKFVKPLDLCPLRQSCTQLRDYVDDHFRSLYFAREQWLHLTDANIRNANRILKNFGKLVRRLKVRGETSAQNFLLDVVLTNCGAMLKCLSLNRLQLCHIDMKKLTGVFDNLKFLELIDCYGNKKYIEQLLLEHEYPNLTTLRMDSTYVTSEILQKFFMRKRSIKNLSCGFIPGDLLTLIALNGSEIEELDIYPEDDRNLMSLVQLRKLKRLEIGCHYCDQESIIALIKELSVNNQLEKLGMFSFEFTDEFCNALSNLTNLNELRFSYATYTLNETKSLEMLGQKLSKLESFTLVNCLGFPHRNFLASACKSDKFRTIYVWANGGQINNFIEQTVKDFIDGRGHRCFVAGDPLCIHLYEDTFNDMKGLLTQRNLQSIEMYGNIKILRANDDVSWF